jgi:hypothetical protein
VRRQPLHLEAAEEPEAHGRFAARGHFRVSIERAGAGNLVCAARIGLCRTVDGRAVPLAGYYRIDADGSGDR